MVLVLQKGKKQEYNGDGNTRKRRVEVHFSEAIWNFSGEDVQVRNCTFERFSMVKEDFFLLDFQLPQDSPSGMSIPPNLVLRKGSHSICNASGATLDFPML